MRLLLFTGTGGSGTTTVAAAVALRAARGGVRTALWTVESAEALRDVLHEPHDEPDDESSDPADDGLLDAGLLPVRALGGLPEITALLGVAHADGLLDQLGLDPVPPDVAGRIPGVDELAAWAQPTSRPADDTATPEEPLDEDAEPDSGFSPVRASSIDPELTARPVADEVTLEPREPGAPPPEPAVAAALSPAEQADLDWLRLLAPPSAETSPQSLGAPPDDVAAPFSPPVPADDQTDDPGDSDGESVLDQLPDQLPDELPELPAGPAPAPFLPTATRFTP